MKILGNSFVIGGLMVLAELAINNLLFSAQLPHISGILLSFGAGALYGFLHKENMPGKERLKTIGVYAVVAGAASVLVLLTGTERTFSVLTIGIMLGLLAVYSTFMYFMLSLGSWWYVRFKMPKKDPTVKTASPYFDILSTPFGKNYPSLVVGLCLLGIGAMYAGIVYIAFDPLTPDSRRPLAIVLAATAALTFILAPLRISEQKRLVGLLGAGVVALISVGMYLLVLNAPPPTAGADQIMISQQKTALNCVAKGSDLERRYRRGFNRGYPNTLMEMCRYESRWELLPDGWEYNKVEDPYVQNGTFMFSARSRAKDSIVCTQKGCTQTAADGTVTVLSSTPAVSVEVLLPEAKDAGPGQRVKVATITLRNTTEETEDLAALWFKKSGTASDAAIETVYVIESEHEMGVNYQYSISAGSNGMAYMDSPEMFLIQPGETRVYGVEIRLSAAAGSEAGHTVGLDFPGFAYEKLIPGMPTVGAVYTIRSTD
ncbi:hypothetical protein KKH15_01900 [Patescibacteria group bacterium]|nr:hypothetical protein [Patescibacteria group bacterium]MBU1754845.1 hypothetical protein [Patescibacteria group bacterium]